MPPARLWTFLNPACCRNVDGLRAASAHFAVDDDLAAGVEFVHALGQIVQRNQMSAEVADLVFVRLAHVEHEEIVFARRGGASVLLT